jgi:phage shock protein C
VNRRLYRCRENRVLAGVASGVAEFFDLDPTLVRVLWFVSIFFGGLTIAVYIGLALIMPLEPAGLAGPHLAPGSTDPATAAGGADTLASVPDGHRHRSRGSGRLSMFLGIGLIVLGSIALLDIALPGWAVSWRQLWPLLVIGFGGLLIFGAMRRDRGERESGDL